MFNPTKTIGKDYLHRWHLIPRNKYFNIYLHKFIGSDYAGALHDHPWDSWSICFVGRLREHLYEGFQRLPNDRLKITTTSKLVPRWRIIKRKKWLLHRLEVVEGTAWTLFVTGANKREWGFLCPEGWTHWSKMTTADGQVVGGCGDE